LYAASGNLTPFVDIIAPLELERLAWYIDVINMISEPEQKADQAPDLTIQ